MNMTPEQALQVVQQSLGEYLDPNRPQIIIVNGPRAELRGVPTAQAQAIVEAVQTLTAMIKNRDGKSPKPKAGKTEKADGERQQSKD